METLDWSVQQDRALLDGASTDKVRQHFRDWAASATGQQHSVAPRYRYCVHVDNESLKSIVNDALQPPAPDFEPIGYVNIICADCALDEDESEDEIEECTQNDVGWMKVPVDGLAPRTYSMLGESGRWEICYVRQPDIAIP